MTLENIDKVYEANQHQLTHEQDIRKKAVIRSLEQCNIPQLEWIFHLVTQINGTGTGIPQNGERDISIQE